MARLAIKHGFNTLLRPHRTFGNIDKLTLERMVKYYLQLIIFMGITAGILTFLGNLAKTFYYDKFLGATVNYGYMLNYLTGKVFGIFLGYLMIGTFGLFLISIILNPFFRMKYTRLLKILFVAITPILILAWIPQAALGVVLWSVILFILGVRDAGTAQKVKKTSLQQRD